MDRDKSLNEAIKRSIFDDPVDLFNFNQIQPSQASYSKMIQQASRSVPGSRRNSNDDHTLDLLLGAKLSLNDRESSFSRKLPFAMTPQEPMLSSFTQQQRQQRHSFDNNGPDSKLALFLSKEPSASSSAIIGNNHATVASTSSSIPIPINTTTPLVSSSNAFTTTITHPPSMDIQPHAPTPWVQPPPLGYGWQNTKHSLCPQFQQFGFCPRHDMCPFIHPMIPPPATTTTSLLYHQPYASMAVPPPNKIAALQQRKTTISQHHQQQQQQQDRFVDAQLQDFIGKLYELCKDQNGCRFLQKKIEQEVYYLQMVFDEIHPYFIELMTDPFGNYLCQKMLEKCNDEQRTMIVEIVAPELVQIALNMHGTRAVQKLIEYLSTPEQIQMVIVALNPNVVKLIKDLNGNHVIQKCLHWLSAEYNQFIYDAVCQNCIEVASHKHGCCVLQRCFDHATMAQKDQLVEEIAKHALPLVQNAFGNYVVQYVLELGVTRYSESVIGRFVNHVCILSVQKFSSNVIENCIRTAEPQTRRLLIAELVNQTAMEKLLHDSFANYVVQTSLDFADEDQRAELVECIRPLLPTIRTTPYGKRIHSKIFRDQHHHKSNKQPLRQQQPRQRHTLEPVIHPTENQNM